MFTHKINVLFNLLGTPFEVFAQIADAMQIAELEIKLAAALQTNLHCCEIVTNALSVVSAEKARNQIDVQRKM